MSRGARIYSTPAIEPSLSQFAVSKELKQIPRRTTIFTSNTVLYRRKNVPTRHSTDNAERHLNALSSARYTARWTRRGSSGLRSKQRLCSYQPITAKHSHQRPVVRFERGRASWLGP